jgi:hypothetical protein
MHDYGSKVRLEDAETGKVLTQVTAERDSAGKLVKVSRKLFGVSGDGLRLKAKHRYRVVGEYDNPTGELRVKGAMASMVGLFVPDDMKRWPAVDPRDPTYQRDLASLDVRGTASSSMEGHSHGGTPDADAAQEAHEGHDAHDVPSSPHTGHESHE